MKSTLFLTLVLAAAATAATVSDLGAGPAAGDYNSPGGGYPVIGSVLQSWQMSGTSSPYALGVARDTSYVYGVFYGSPCFLRSYSATGSAVGSVTLAGFSTARGASDSHLGTGYVAIADASTNMIRIVYKPTGSTVSSFGVTPAGGGYLLDCAYNGAYYFAAGGSSKGSFNLYTTSGSSAGTWTASGASSIASTGGYDWSPWVDNQNNGGTGYLIIMSWNAGGTNFIVTYPQGSLVGSWAMAGMNANGCFVGPASDPARSPDLWALMYNGSALMVYEIDLGNYNVGVAPRSLGCVKALYR